MPNEDMEKDGSKFSREEYLNERNLLIDTEREAARSFDKSIIALVGGSLGFSLALIQQFPPKEGSLQILAFSWGFLIVSLIITLISFLTSQSAMRRQREIIDETFLTNNVSERNIWGNITKCLNIASITFFILGVILFLYFTYENIKT
jgi:hypothetical protein